VWNGEAWVIEMKRRADTSDPELCGWRNDAMRRKGCGGRGRRWWKKGLKDASLKNKDTKKNQGGHGRINYKTWRKVLRG